MTDDWWMITMIIIIIIILNFHILLVYYITNISAFCETSNFTLPVIREV